MYYSGLGKSFEAIKFGVYPGRLFIEDEGVVGNGWFSKRRGDFFHTIANVLRLFLCVVFAPVYLLVPRTTTAFVYNKYNEAWRIETVTVPNAALTRAPAGDGKGRYEGSAFNPRWVIRLIIRNGKYAVHQQIPWSEDVRLNGYVALSYPVQSAAALVREMQDRMELKSRAEDLDYPYGPRQRWEVAKQLLFEYASARGRLTPNCTEYVWIDELCLTEEGQFIDWEVRRELRNFELGRMADIFRRATQVCVFCDLVDCDHTSTYCLWGSRVFTLSEIIHANAVIRMTRRRVGELGQIESFLYPESAYAFRAAIQANAAEVGSWHLYAIMQHSINSGAVPWQVAIHSLIVEAIRRDEAGGYVAHNYLGKALNGLLPRRARLVDLKGTDGWADLAWLLELNQGFYNAAGLAAVCSVSADNTEKSKHRWLGRPIPQVEGNERLEPLATAFPVEVSKTKDGSQPALCLVGSQSIGLRHTLKRDPSGLYNNEIMRPFKNFVQTLFWIFFLCECALAVRDFRAGLALLYLDTVAYTIVTLLVGTMFVVRDGWVFLRDSEWGRNPEASLCTQDQHLARLENWGEMQLAPEWRAPGVARDNCRWERATLVDLRYRVYLNVIVIGRPNSLVTLAIHGSGITCMLLDRPDDPKCLAKKVGMTNIPAYVLGGTETSSTVYIT